MGGSADRDAALRLITKALTRAGAEGEYVLVVLWGRRSNEGGGAESHPRVASRHARGVGAGDAENVTRIVFVNASWFTGALISWTMTFTSSKTREKFVWVNSLHTMEKESGFFVNPAMCGEAHPPATRRKQRRLRDSIRLRGCVDNKIVSKHQFNSFTSSQP